MPQGYPTILWILKCAVNDHAIIEPFVLNTFSWLIVLSACFLLLHYSISVSVFEQTQIKAKLPTCEVTYGWLERKDWDGNEERGKERWRNEK